MPPIYEYRCSRCGVEMERFERLNDPHPQKCPHCNAKDVLNRVISRSSFIIK